MPHTPNGGPLSEFTALPRTPSWTKCGRSQKKGTAREGEKGTGREAKQRGEGKRKTVKTEE